MKALHHKHEILRSIEALDQTQTEKVLEYIQVLLQSSKQEASYRKIKRDALKEIRQALKNGPRFSASF
jgi:tellurite resistance protein